MQYEIEEENMELKDRNLQSIEAESVVTQKEAERRHLTSAEKRKRNETLAIGLSRKELLISETAEEDKSSAGDVRNSGSA